MSAGLYIGLAALAALAVFVVITAQRASASRRDVKAARDDGSVGYTPFLVGGDRDGRDSSDSSGNDGGGDGGGGGD